MRSALQMLLLCACGASPRMMQQSTTYYEECQAAELNPSRSLDQRRECWVAWLEHYTLGQPLERVGYAQERRIALAHGEEIAPLPDREDPGLEIRSVAQEPEGESPELAGAEDGAEETFVDSLPIADPNDFRQDDGAPPGRHFPVRTVSPPDEAPIPGPPSNIDGPCAQACNPAWLACAEGCRGHAGSCLNACVSHHRQCMGACNGGEH